jgi:hypothetical protein
MQQQSFDATVAPAPPRSWWQRNWKWAVGCLTILALVAVLMASIALFVFTMFRHTDVFREAIARAEANPQVRTELGEPIREGWWVMGQVRITGPSGRANLAISLKGSRKDGTLYAVARKSAGIWKYDTLEVAVEGRPGRISLLVGEGRDEERLLFEPHGWSGGEACLSRSLKSFLMVVIAFSYRWGFCLTRLSSISNAS